MDAKPLKIDEKLAARLVADQFPQWKDLSVDPVTVSGWDNRTFRLGEQLLIRMPSGPDYALQVEKEYKWLPKLAPFLPFRIPEPVAMGQPTKDYPWKWSINRWIEGESALHATIANQCDFAKNLAQFLLALQDIDATGGPVPGLHSFYRGGSLRHYDAQTQQAIAILGKKIDVKTVTKIWDSALASVWNRDPVWVHGDVSASNLIVQNGQLHAVIDFGQLTIGDPACDLAIAWTFFEGKSQETFRTALSYDTGTWERAQGWALWKALIVQAGLCGASPADYDRSLYVLNALLQQKLL